MTKKINYSNEEIAELLIEEITDSLFYFDKLILGYKDMQEEVHLQLCEFVNDRYLEPGEIPKPFKLILLPRGSFKTSVVTVGYTIQSIVKNPNIRILIANEKFDNAKDFLSEIKGHFESNSNFISTYGDYVSKVGWREDNIVVSKRIKNLKEPTVSCAGVEVVKVGMHYDLIIMDDLVSDKNTATKEQMEKVKDFYRLALSLLEPGGKIIVIGCLTGDTKVLMGNTSWKNIKDIKVGDIVFSYKDKKLVKRTVEAVIPQGKSKVYRVETSGHSIKATDRHPFLVLDKNSEVVWKKVEELEIGDKVIVLARANNETSKRFYDGRFLDKDFYYMLGYFFGDGWVVKSKNKGIVGYCFAKSIYPDRNKKVLDLVKKWFKKSGKETPNGYYRFEDAVNGRWLADNGLIGGAKNKRIPDWLFAIKSSHKKAFIDGLLDSDGYRYKNGDGCRIEIVNKGLIEDIYWLAITCGYRVGKICARKRTIKAPNSKDEITNDFYSLSLAYNTRQSFGLNQYNWRWERIKKVEELGEEEVYDLTINDTGNFIANGYVVHNTRWNFNDLYNHLIENEKHRFNYYVRGAYNPDGSLWFPQRLTKEFLEDQRKSQSSYQFACQYLNSPIDDENAAFKKEWIKYYHIKQGNILIPEDKDPKAENYTLEQCRLYLHIDLATSENKYSDFSAFVITAISPEDFIYVLEAKKLRVNLTEIINMIFDYYAQYRPSKILLEVQATQQMVRYPLFEEQKKRRIYLPIEEVQHKWYKSKINRIKGLIPRFEFGTIYLKPDMQDLEDELLRFPVGQHDDLIDALSFGLAYWKKPTAKIKTNIPKYSFYKILENKKNKKNDMFKKYIEKPAIIRG